MNQNILHVGLDVDDTQYHGSAFNKESGEVIDFRCRPTLKGLLTQLDKLQHHFRGCSIRLCYEASYVGFCLQRDLRAHGCEMLTLGQYLQPSRDHLPVDRFVTPDEFEQLRELGERMGFSNVASGPMVRSSYHADLQADPLLAG